jgi:hypothetical protein
VSCELLRIPQSRTMCFEPRDRVFYRAGRDVYRAALRPASSRCLRPSLRRQVASVCTQPQVMGMSGAYLLTPLLLHGMLLRLQNCSSIFTLCRYSSGSSPVAATQLVRGGRADQSMKRVVSVHEDPPLLYYTLLFAERKSLFEIQALK